MEEPEQLFIRFADDVFVAFGFVDAGEPAEVWIVPKIARDDGRFGFYVFGLSLNEQQDFDAGCGAPGIVAFHPQGLEGFGEWLAETEAIKENKCFRFWIPCVNGFGERLQDAPGEHWAPERRGSGERTG